MLKVVEQLFGSIVMLMSAAAFKIGIVLRFRPGVEWVLALLGTRVLLSVLLIFQHFISSAKTPSLGKFSSPWCLLDCSLDRQSWRRYSGTGAHWVSHLIVE